jgi:hypothetical protein
MHPEPALPEKGIVRGVGCGRGKREAAKNDVGLTVKPFTRKTHPRASGQAARRLPRLKRNSEGATCKRRDAVRLAQSEPARPAGAAFGGLSGATVSWAAPRQTLLRKIVLSTRSWCRLQYRASCARQVWQNLGAEAATCIHRLPAEYFLEKHGSWTRCRC